MVRAPCQAGKPSGDQIKLGVVAKKGWARETSVLSALAGPLLLAGLPRPFVFPMKVL